MTIQTKWLLLGALVVYVLYVKGRQVPAASGPQIVTDGPYGAVA